MTEAEKLQKDIDTLNHFQMLAKRSEKYSDEYLSNYRMVNTLVSKITTLYEKDPILNPMTNTWAIYS